MNKKIIVIIILSIITGLVLLNLVKTKDIKIEKTQKQVNNTNMLTMMLETEVGTGNYEEVTQSEWPQGGYVFNESLSRCENGGTLSWNDETKKVVLNTDKSDKCYVYFDIYVEPTLATITKVEATEVAETSIKVSVEAIKGDYEINKYYYSIDDGGYVESTSNSYTFNNLIPGTEYKIEVYVEDEEGNKSEVYELNQSTANNIGAITVNQNMTLNVSEYSVASSINFTGNYTLTINGGGTLEVASITSSNGTNKVGSATNGANITINLENVKLVNNTITSGYGGNGTGDAGSDGGRGSEYSKDGKDGDAATATVQGGNGGTITINIDENSEFISQTITTGKGGNATGAAGGNGGAGANATSGGSNEYRTGGNGGNGGNGSNSIGGSSGSVVINNQGIVTINSVITDKGGDAYGGNGGDGGDRGDHYSSSHLYASGGDGGNGGDATGGNSGSITINGNGQSLINNASTGAVGVSTAGTGGNGGSGDSYGSRGETGNIISGTKGVISGI